MTKKGYHQVEEHKKKIGAANSGKARPDMCGEGNPMKKESAKEKFRGDRSPTKRPEVRKKMKENWARLIQDPEFRKKWFPGHAAQNNSEKKLQDFLDQCFPGQWLFVGNGQKRIVQKCPDFAHISKPLLIELFGDYWHGQERTGIPNKQHEKERVQLFETQGYRTLVIWEHELENLSKITQRVTNFLQVEKDRKPSVYYAVPIRGHLGEKAPIQYMAENCARAKHNLQVLQAMYPEIEWINVAPFDRIVQKLLARGQVAIENILQADFEVGDECDGLLAHLWEPSKGADQEFDRQISRGKVCARLRPRMWQIWLMTDMKVLENFVAQLMNRELYLHTTPEEEQKDKGVVKNENEGE